MRGELGNGRSGKTNSVPQLMSDPVDKRPNSACHHLQCAASHSCTRRVMYRVRGCRVT